MSASNYDQVICRKLVAQDFEPLLQYLHQLSDDTKKRFGPHPFDRESVISFYNHGETITGYIAEEISSGSIIAYAIIKSGGLHHDRERLQQYGVNPNEDTDCTFAPSVADHWQSKGIGKKLFHFILDDLKSKNIQRIILWGGVQSGNEKAVNFYNRLGFHTLGSFEYNGANLDMMLEI